MLTLWHLNNRNAPTGSLTNILSLIVVFNEQIRLFYLIERERMNGRWSLCTKAVDLVGATTALFAHLVSFWPLRAL
jgi:hypothetical protein